MRIIYEDGYTDNEKRGFIKFICQNIYEATSELIRSMKDLKIPYEYSDNLVNLLIIH